MGGKRASHDRCVVSTMQFIHIRYTKHEDNEKDENEEFNFECLHFWGRNRDKILSSRFSDMSLSPKPIYRRVVLL